MAAGAVFPRRGRVSPRLAELIAGELREQILGGVHSTGELPKQDDLVARFGVSAPPLREALRILEGEGLITVRRGKAGGAVVHMPDGGSIARAMGIALQGGQVRLADLASSVVLVEPLCASLCASDEAVRAALRPLIEANLERTADAVGDGPSFTRRARRFHDLVVAHTPVATTRIMVRGLVTIWSAQEEIWAHEVSDRGRYPTTVLQRRALDAHRRIADRIVSGDAGSAERFAREHVGATQRAVLAQFGDRVVDASSERAVRGLRDPTPHHAIGVDPAHAGQ